MLLPIAGDHFLNHLIAKQRSPQTIDGYGKDLRMLNRYLSGEWNGPVYIEEITSEDIESYMAMLLLEKAYAKVSVNRHLNTIRSFFHYVYKRKWVPEDVSLTVESLTTHRQERTYLTEAEINPFIEAVKHPLIQVAVRTMIFTGLRVSECTNLTLKDVDLEHRVIHVVSGKGNKDRKIPISDSLWPYLKTYLDHERVQTTSDRFFATKKTGELSQQYINRALRDTTEQLGWQKKVSCHHLRHSFGSLLVAKNVNVVKISKLMGHADVRTTSIYTHTSQKELSEAVNLLT